MKKKMNVILGIAALCFLTACGNSNNTAAGRTGKQSTGVNDILQERMGESNSSILPETEQPTETPVAQMTETEATTAPVVTDIPDEAGDDHHTENEYGLIDVDLTTLSSTMVYAEVYQMMTSPEDYIGKTVRMSGTFDYYHDESTGRYYLACIVQDATACCAQGIEFVPSGSFRCPEDFPEVGELICVAGVFDTYMEGEYRYCTLRNAVFVN